MFKAISPVSESESSRCAQPAQPLQDLIDRILFRLAGLSDNEAAALETRLLAML